MYHINYTTMEQRLIGKIAFITGGGSGIGLATAQLFARHGASVVITGRNQLTLDQALDTLDGQCFGVQANVTRVDELDHAYEQAVERFGKIDVLFANAGVGLFAPIEASTEELYDDLMNTNVKGVFFTVQRAIPYLSERASIILSSSFLALTGIAHTSVLSASKAAVTSFGKTLAAELGPKGIRVNTLSPGYIATSFAAKAGLPQEALTGLAQNAVMSTPLRRFGMPDEMAKVALFLASDDSSYLVGSDVLADGGVVYA